MYCARLFSVALLGGCMDLELPRPSRRAVEVPRDRNPENAGAGGQPLAPGGFGGDASPDGDQRTDEGSATPPDGTAREPTTAPSASGARLGAACELGSECSSTICVGGVCCNRACGSCEACSSEGTCVPRRECTFAVCDAGVCRPTLGPLGARCQSKEECESGFCSGGVCCESECSGTCERCSDRGFCNEFPRVDPTCPSVTCTENTTCLSFTPPPRSQCASFGSCAGAEQCSLHYTAAGIPCADGLVCDGRGACNLENQALALNPTQLCPAAGAERTEARANLSEPITLCWVDQPDGEPLVLAQGGLSVGHGGPESRIISVYLYTSTPDIRSAKAQAYDDAGVLLTGCVAVDTTRGNVSVDTEFHGPICRGAAYVLVTAHGSPTGDL